VYNKGAETLNKMLKNHVYICGVSRKNPPQNPSLNVPIPV